MEKDRVMLLVKDRRFKYGYEWAEIIKDPIKCKEYANNYDYVCNQGKCEVYQDRHDLKCYVLIPN